MLIKDLVGISRPKVGEYFGVEVEMEGGSLPNSNFGNWKVVGDNSLQGGLEYVMIKPNKFDSAQKDIHNLYSEFKRHVSVLNPSIRSGVHVHYNVQDWDVRKLFTFICTYLCLENIVIKNYAGAGRFGNLFCIPASRAEAFTESVVRFLKTGDRTYLQDEGIRYSALNLNSIFKYGSLEFRSLATPKDPHPILRWMQIIRNISAYANGFSNPQDVINNFSAVLSKEFLEGLFVEPVEVFDMQDFWEGVDQAQQIAFCVKSWDSLVEKWGVGNSKDKPRPVARDMNDFLAAIDADNRNPVWVDPPHVEVNDLDENDGNGYADDLEEEED